MYEQLARNRRRTVLYIVLFVAVWIAVGGLLGWAWNASSGSASGSRVTADVLTGVAVAVLLATLGVLFSLWSGAELVLAVSGARPADHGRYLQVHDLVEALAIGAELPVPALYVIDDPSPNAFATGTSPKHAAITVTTGLLATMNREELEGVLAHEMSHIKNLDVRLLLVVATLIGMAGLLASLVWRSAFVLRPRGRNAGASMLVVLAAGVLFSLVAVVFGPLTRLALSRRREELADVSGVQLTRNPAGLLSALRKLQTNDEPFARFNHATAAMCIDDPLQHHEGRLHRLFDTHPPLSERIAILEQIATGQTV